MKKRDLLAEIHDMEDRHLRLCVRVDRLERAAAEAKPKAKPAPLAGPSVFARKLDWLADHADRILKGGV